MSIPRCIPTEGDAGPLLSTYGKACANSNKQLLRLHQNMRDAYHECNLDGVINIGVAENTVMHEELREYFEKNFRLRPFDFTYGDGLTGTTRLCKAVSAFLNTRFNPCRPVLPDHLVMGGGLIPIMSQVGRVLADPGDGVLLAAPYYHGFDVSLVLANGILPIGVPVPLCDMFTLAELVHLERGIQKSNVKDTTIKAVILCNPHNPLGRCYPQEVVAAYCQFCEKHGLHLLSDELYAFSVFPSNDIPHPQPFVSALSMDLQSLGVDPARVHVLYGMSKDFNANGFRAGAFISQSNPLIIRALTVTAMFMLVSSLTDSLWSTLLNDQDFLPIFLEKNQCKLREAYEYATTWFNFHGLPYIPACAGHFVMVDLRPVLADIGRYGVLLGVTPEHSMREREAALSAFLLSHKVTIKPGSGCHALESGWFRFTFSVRRDFMDVALVRIERAFGWEQWPGLAGV